MNNNQETPAVTVDRSELYTAVRTARPDHIGISVPTNTLEANEIRYRLLGWLERHVPSGDCDPAVVWAEFARKVGVVHFLDRCRRCRHGLDKRTFTPCVSCQGRRNTRTQTVLDPKRPPTVIGNVTRKAVGQ